MQKQIWPAFSVHLIQACRLKVKANWILFILGLFHIHHTDLSCKCGCLGHWMTLTGLFSNGKLNCLQFSDDFIHFPAPVFAVFILISGITVQCLPFVISCPSLQPVRGFLLWKAFNEHPYHAAIQVMNTHSDVQLKSEICPLIYTQVTPIFWWHLSEFTKFFVFLS